MTKHTLGTCGYRSSHGTGFGYGYNFGTGYGCGCSDGDGCGDASPLYDAFRYAYGRGNGHGYPGRALLVSGPLDDVEGQVLRVLFPGFVVRIS